VLEDGGHARAAAAAAARVRAAPRLCDGVSIEHHVNALRVRHKKMEPAHRIAVSGTCARYLVCSLRTACSQACHIKQSVPAQAFARHELGIGKANALDFFPHAGSSAQRQRLVSIPNRPNPVLTEQLRAVP